MKRILITGENSYIGTSFERYMQQFSDEYIVDTISVIGEDWKGVSFDNYDVVFHVAGIAHADVGKVSEEGKKLYYKVNKDLTVEVAKRLKESANRLKCVKQFIFMSSIIVYGENTSVNSKKIITRETQPNPSNFYGDSKWQAEKKLQTMNNSVYFNLVILRPPMIYGPGSKGNYLQLIKFAKVSPVFPHFKNERSILFIGNLCGFIKKRIDNDSTGVFFPHNTEIVSTSKIVNEIATTHGKNIFLFSGLNWGIRLMGYLPGKIGKVINKAFGNLTIEVQSDSNQYSFEESIKFTEEH